MAQILGWLHDPIVAGLLAVLALGALGWRWVRLDRGALAGLAELKDVLPTVHGASRRQVFTEAALAATGSLLIVASFAALYPGLPAGGLRTVRSWVLSPAPAEAQGFAPAGAVLGLALASAILVLFTYLIPLNRDRHHWLATLWWLHRPRKQGQQACEARTCEALAYATNLTVFQYAVRARPAPGTLADEWYDLLLSVNRHHLQLMSERDLQAKRSRLLQRLKAHSEQSGEPVLIPGRLRAAFGGRWPPFLGAALVFGAAALFVAAVAGLVPPPK